ncbi:MAG TPA: hypothetical protein IAC25_02520 [Candidatus Enterenecus stercoripullorum]|nr:hypothetical protein [Candidatus Enterenecus stercoripullorum]
MKIIAKTPASNGAYPPPQDWGGLVPPEGYYQWPDSLDTADFYVHSGFVTLTTARNLVMDYEPNTEAWEAWKSTQPDPIDEAKVKKEADLSAACNAAIVEGMDVETVQGTEHFSLEETDQINLTAAHSAIQAGAPGYPYHADGKLCRMFAAQEINAISAASIAHKLYHTTLCNHLLTWVRRAETIEEVNGITYTAEGMPEDLAANMAQILSTAQNG